MSEIRFRKSTVNTIAGLPRHISSFVQDPLRIGHRPHDASDATSPPNVIDEVPLSWCRPASGCLDLDGGEDSNSAADHVGCDGDGPVADEIGSTGRGNTELDPPAGTWIWELAGVVAPEADAWQGADCESDSLLKVGFGVRHESGQGSDPIMSGA